jgi:hypothetical protein
MTAHSVDRGWPLRSNPYTRSDHAAGLKAKSAALIDETQVLRRCAQYRDAFSGTAISCPAAFLGFDAVAAWICRHRVTVDVSTNAELDWAAAAGILPAQIVVHAQDASARATCRAANARAARFVVGSSEQIEALADATDERTQVVIDSTDDAVGGLASEVLAHRQLELIGMHCRLSADDTIGSLSLRRTIAEMAWVRRRYGVLLTRVSVADLDVGDRCEPWIIGRIAEAIHEVIGDACARHRYPRPALTVAPSRLALLPV